MAANQVHGYNTKFTCNDTAGTERDISADGNDVTITSDMPLADVTGFGSVSKSFVAGQYGWKVDYKGFYNTASNIGADTVLGPLSISTACGSVNVAFGGSASGQAYYKGSAFCTAYGRTAGVGGGVNVTASFTGNGPLTRGTIA